MLLLVAAGGGAGGEAGGTAARCTPYRPSLRAACRPCPQLIRQPAHAVLSAYQYHMQVGAGPYLLLLLLAVALPAHCAGAAPPVCRV